MKYKEIWKTYGKVFDNNTFNYLNDLYNDKYIKEDLVLISEGKEAVVFRSGKVALKIYKIMSRSYKEQVKYIKLDPRIRRYPRSLIGLSYLWVKKEYMNLRRMYMNLVKVPIPYTYKGNILVMEYIGYDGVISLHNYYKNITDKSNFFYAILDEYKKIYNKAKLVHGDFSEYNIIIYNDIPYIIDVSQSIPVNSPSACILLERDIKNIHNISRKLSININYDDIKKYIGI